MNEPASSTSSPAAALRAAAAGAVVAVLSSALLRFEDALVALLLLAGALLISAAVLLARHARIGARQLASGGAAALDLRALAACSAAGATLWLLAPWANAEPQGTAELARETTKAERAWLCGSSLLSTPYVLPRARVLLASEARSASLLHACAEARASERVDVAPARPRSHDGTSLRALARARARGGYDLVLLAVQRPAHALPLGALPFADAPLETAEGVRDLFSLLAPNGMMAATMLGQPAALRWIHTARAGLRAAGVPDAERHFVVYAAAGAYTVLARPTPFDTDALLKLHEAWRAPGPVAPAQLQRWPAWLRTRPTLEATPGSAFDTRMAQELREDDEPRQTAAYALDIRAASDDRPLFYELTRRDRFDTWFDGTSYWVMAWSNALALTFAAVLTWLAARLAARRLPAVKRHAPLILGHCVIALGHALAFAFAQQRLGLWLSRPFDAPALCVLALGGSAAIVFALGTTRAGTPRALAFARSLWAPALLMALAATRTPDPQLIAKIGPTSLGWLALASACALGGALALAALEWHRRIPLALRTPALVAYVAGLAAGVLLGPGLVLLSGYRSCAIVAACALALTATVALTPAPRQT